jgi:hypothetical protein
MGRGKRVYREDAKDAKRFKNNIENLIHRPVAGAT